MKNKLNEIHNFLKQGKIIVFLFCLDFLSIILVFITAITNNGSFGTNSIFFLVLSALCAVLAVYLLINNISLAKKVETYLINTNYVKNPTRIKLFHRLLKENLFEYHFQPIICARTGEIFAYEALMRSGPKFDMPPLEILELAAYESRLYDIERFTFTNTLKILHDN